MLLLCSFSLQVFAQKKAIAQKPVIDTSVLGKWPSVGGAAISNDGKYVCYTINNQPVGSHTLVVQSTEGDWKREFVNASGAVFTDDSRKVVFSMTGDSLCLLSLGTNTLESIPHVRSFQLAGKGQGEWLAYQTKDATNELVLTNLATGKEKRFASVDNYLFSHKGNVCAITQHGLDSGHAYSLLWVDLLKDNKRTIWKGDKVSYFVFDEQGSQLAFMADEKENGQNANAIWYYEKGMETAEYC